MMKAIGKGGDIMFRYIGCCVDWNGKSRAEIDELIKMVDTATDITYQTFIRHISIEQIIAIKTYPFDDYYWKPGKSIDLRLKDDWAVSFHKGQYHGKKVYFMKHSGIEYIFMERGRTQ